MADKDPKDEKIEEQVDETPKGEEEVDAGVVEEQEEAPVEEGQEETSAEEEEIEDVSEPVEEVTKEELKDAEKQEKVEIPDFRTGDTVRVLYKIIEGNKTRLQPYEGIVIAKKGAGVSQTFTVRRIGADNVGVERIFPLYSPNITKLEVKKHGKTKRSKLYYLRDKVGKAAVRVKDRKVKAKAA